MNEWPVGWRSVFSQEAILKETNNQFARISFGHSASASQLCRVENQELVFVRFLHFMSNGVKFIINRERINYFSAVVEKPRIGFFPKEKKGFRPLLTRRHGQLSISYRSNGDLT